MLRRLAFLALGVFAGSFVPTDADASVSIAVAFDSLVKDADGVAIVTPVESKSAWEDGRIYTYTKLHVEQGVAGNVGSESWVRTMGGVVGKIGQLVDGEPTFTKDKPSLVFLRTFKSGGMYEVSARAQGQYPVTVDQATKMKRIYRSASVGMLLPPKTRELTQATPGPVIQPQSISAAATARLAQEVLHDKPLDDVTKEISTTWKRLHPAK
jgi:hypothetical protein